MKPREAAYLALLSSHRDGIYLTDTLNKWREESQPNQLDANFAQEIAYGTMRMTSALDFLAQQLSDKKKLKLKLKEKVLLRVALYQYFYMDRVPIYAIADESTKLAHKYCHGTFVGFLNAVLRNLSEKPPTLPKEDSLSDISIRYSYPLFFVERLFSDYGMEKTLDILEAENSPAPTMVRVRPAGQILPGMRILCSEPFPMAVLEDSSKMKELLSSSNYYIQNATPATLIGQLAKSLPKTPDNILDLCAAPGGKSICVHDLFPKAKIWANDVSEQKVQILRDNFKKYDVNARLSCSPGQFLELPEKVDLVILDVPCSNSGVLNKRPEARWRLSQESMAQLEQLQMQLVENALRLLKQEGQLWLMTCSILKMETEGLVKKICENFEIPPPIYQETILPNTEGWDGGFAAVLRQNHK